LKRSIIVGLAAALLVSPAWAQSPNSSSAAPDRFQIDAGYFNLKADTLLRYTGPQGGSGDINFEKDLGQNRTVNTFWVDSTWRVGRRHQLKLSYTQLSRDQPGHTLERGFVWGGKTYTAGLSATSNTSSKILGGYYRFALVRNDRFEIGPTIGIGHLTMGAGIKATGTVGSQSVSLDQSTSTGSVTGAVGGYATATPMNKLALHADYLYVKVTPGTETATVTDWRLAADYYVTRGVGLGAQYKYNRYSLDRGLLSTSLGGQITFQGVQAFLTFRF